MSIRDLKTVTNAVEPGCYRGARVLYFLKYRNLKAWCSNFFFFLMLLSRDYELIALSRDNKACFFFEITV